MKTLRAFWWAGIVFLVLYPMLQLVRGVRFSWGLELAVLALLLVPLGFFAVQGSVSNRPQGRVAGRPHVVRAPRQPIVWPPALLMTAYVVGGLSLVFLLLFALTGHTGHLKAAIILAIATLGAGFGHWKGKSFFLENWARLWLFMSLVWVAWVAGFGFQSWKELILPGLSFLLALIVVLGVTKEVVQALGKAVVWVFGQLGQLLTGKYGAIPAAIGYWVLCIMGVFAFAGSNPGLAYLFGVGGGIATFIIFFLPGKKAVERMQAR